MPAVPTRIPAAETPGRGVAIPMLVAALIVGALYVGREILIPIAIAVLLSFVLWPLVSLLRRLHLGRMPSIGLSVLACLGIVGLLALVIGMQVADLGTNLPGYQRTIEHKLERLREGPVGSAATYLRTLGQHLQQAGAASEDSAKTQDPTAPHPTPTVQNPDKPVLVEMRERGLPPLELAERLLAPIAAPLATTGIVFVVLMFILGQREDLRDRLIRLAGSSDLHRTTVAMNDAARRLSRFFLVQLALNASFGVAIGVGLWAIGVPSPILWGIFSALMRFVPYIGAFVSALLPLALAAAVDPGWTMVIETAALFLVLEPLVGQVVEPLLYGHSTGLSPFAVLVSALFWTWLWGPVGLLLSTPLTVCLVVLGRHVDQLEFLDVLFGDRPALTPVENFYQRLLADDPDEAQALAEALLSECSLSSYYDDVVLKGLQLAASDARRGVLTGEQLERIRKAIDELVTDLADRDDAAPQAAPSLAGRLLNRETEGPCDAAPAVPDGPPPEALPAAWRQKGAVLCVAGRGLLDEAASTMLSQLLEKRGLGTRVVPFGAVSRAEIASLDAGEARMVCISYLEISGTPAHLRYLIQRVRRRLPGARVLVGLWPVDDVVLADSEARASLGADDYVTSLREGVEACLKAAAGAQTERPQRVPEAAAVAAGPRPEAVPAAAPA
ncbi:AI-2E family transporter [Methylobacterium sp. JK268]